MKNLIQKIKNLRNIKWNFQLAFIFSISLVILFGIIYIIIYKPFSNQSSTNTDNSVPAIVDVKGNLLATYDVQTTTGYSKKVINIYVDDPSTISGIQIKSLTQQVLQKTGLKEDEVFINFKQFPGLSNGKDSFPTTPTYDPTDPSTFSNVPTGYNSNTKEDIVNVDFRKYVDAVSPRTDDFDIYKKDNNNYLIVLKQDYTEDRFKSEYLKQFTGLSGINFEFKRQTDLVDQSF